MKKLLFILLLSMLSTLSFSKNHKHIQQDEISLIGYIIDYKSYDAISYAEIKITNMLSNNTYVAYTDYSGKYTFINIEKGEYKLFIDYNDNIDCDSIIIDTDYKDLNILVKTY